MSIPIASNQTPLLPLQIENQQTPVLTGEFSSTCGKTRIAASIVLGLSGFALLCYTGQYWEGEPIANPSDRTRFYANSCAYMSFMSTVSLLTTLRPYAKCGKAVKITTRVIGTLITGLAATGQPGVNNFGTFGFLGPLIAFSPEIAKKFC